MWTTILVAYIATWSVSWTIIGLWARKHNISFYTANYYAKTFSFMRGEISVLSYLKYLLFDRTEKKAMILKFSKKDAFVGAYVYILAIVTLPLDLIGWIAVTPLLVLARYIGKRRNKALAV